MKAVVITSPGGPEVLQLKEVEDPQIKDDEVLIKVAATALNRADALQRQGKYPTPTGESEYPGVECSGTIEAVGKNVSRWKIGDQVCALVGGGGYAEKVAVPAGQVLPVPAGVSLQDAASFPEVACTVWSTIFMMSRLSSGETFLVHGGSSGIGTFAIQIAKYQGAKVFVTAGSEEKLAACKDLGADVCINYKTEDFVARVKEETGGRGVDVILDNIGGPYFQQNLDSLNFDGRLFIIGFMGGTITEVNLSGLLARRLTVQDSVDLITGALFLGSSYLLNFLLNIMDITKMDRGQITVLGSGFCVLLTIHFTVQLLYQHLFYWKNPKEQKAILIIILMAPVYAVDSFVGLMDFRGGKAFFMFLDSIKECYEALVIAKFFALMYSYLNISISKNIVPDEIKGREIHHSFPMTLFQPRTTRLNHQTLKLLKYWTWQFVIIRPGCSFLTITLQILGMYPSWVSWMFSIILNISFFVAMYSLLAFYHVFAKELEPHKPLAKFICIKGIVFFSFWQGIGLDILAAAGIIRSQHFWLDVEHVEEAIENVLICVEMVVFSVIQQYAYHVAPYSGDVDAILKSQKKYE